MQAKRRLGSPQKAELDPDEASVRNGRKRRGFRSPHPNAGRAGRKAGKTANDDGHRGVRGPYNGDGSLCRGNPATAGTGWKPSGFLGSDREMIEGQFERGAYREMEHFRFEESTRTER